MELIGVLDRRRLQRELRRREVELREAARAREAAEPPKPESLVGRLQRELRRREVELRAERQPVEAAEPPKPESLVARSPSTPRRWWECDFCGRGFHGYGQFLNHNCHRGD